MNQNKGICVVTECSHLSELSNYKKVTGPSWHLSSTDTNERRIPVGEMVKRFNCNCKIKNME